MLIILFISTIILRYVDIVDVSNKVIRLLVGYHKFALFFTLSYNFMMVVFLFGIHSSSNDVIKSLFGSVFDYLFSIFCFIIIMLELRLFKTSIIQKLEAMLNSKFAEDFPIIALKSSDLNLEGQLCDIFNDKLLILKDNNQYHAISWELITTLTLIENYDC